VPNFNGALPAVKLIFGPAGHSTLTGPVYGPIPVVWLNCYVHAVHVYGDVGDPKEKSLHGTRASLSCRRGEVTTAVPGDLAFLH